MTSLKVVLAELEAAAERYKAGQELAE